jgi:hypothetical protein
MALRFSDANLWNRDWFLELDGKMQLFALYLRDQCDHAGVWQPAFKRFESISGFRINPQEYLAAVNSDKVRIVVLGNGKWWITRFIEDQYRGLVLNLSNPVMRGVVVSLESNNIPYESMGYKIDPTKTPPKTLPRPYVGSKDKDKDILGKECERNPSADDGVDLESIYQAYPKHVAKASAMRAIGVAVKKISPDRLLAAVKEYANSSVGQDPQYIPNPSSWFDDERWLDEKPAAAELSYLDAM